MNVETIHTLKIDALSSLNRKTVAAKLIDLLEYRFNNTILTREQAKLNRKLVADLKGDS